MNLGLKGNGSWAKAEEKQSSKNPRLILQTSKRSSRAIKKQRKRIIGIREKKELKLKSNLSNRLNLREIRRKEEAISRQMERQTHRKKERETKERGQILKMLQRKYSKRRSILVARNIRARNEGLRL